MFENFENQVRQAIQDASNYEGHPRISVNDLPLRDPVNETEERLVKIAKKKAKRIALTGLAFSLAMIVSFVLISVTNGTFELKYLLLLIIFGIVFLGILVNVIEKHSRVVTGVVAFKEFNSRIYGNSMTRTRNRRRSAPKIDVIVDGTNSAICTVEVAPGEFQNINPGDPVLIINVFLANYECYRYN